MNRILTFDTTCPVLYISLIEDYEVKAVVETECNSKHSVMLLSEIDKMLKEQDLKIDDINTFALSVGPGSFTGIRIGVCTVLGFTHAKNKKIIAVNSLEVDAYNHINERDSLLSIIDAKHNNCYFAKYIVENEKLKEEKIGFVKKEELEKLKTHDTLLSSPFENSFEAKVTTNFYRGFEKLVIEKDRNKDYVEKSNLAPLYLKKSQAEEEMESGLCKRFGD